MANRVNPSFPYRKRLQAQLVLFKPSCRRVNLLPPFEIYFQRFGTASNNILEPNGGSSLRKKSIIFSQSEVITYQSCEEPKNTREKDSLTKPTIERIKNGVDDGVYMQQRREEVGLICLPLEKRCFRKTQNGQRCANFECTLASQLFRKTLRR